MKQQMKFLASKRQGHLSLSFIIFFVFMTGFPLSFSVQIIKLPENETVPAILVFGDSIVDPGNNNNNARTMARCNFPPYGKDLKGRKPTGRFSNGKIPPDFIAEAFGIKELVPAYLDPNLQIEDLLTGVSFATGGTGYDPLTDKLASVYSLSDQLDLFKDYIRRIKTAVGEERTAFILSKSIALVCLGSNDISNTYFTVPFRSSHYDIDSYTDLLINSAINFYQELYALGARRLGVFGVPSIGCVPSQRTIRGGLRRECSGSENQAAQLFNSKLSSALDSLAKKFPDARFVYVDIYNPLLSLIQNPAKYGFEVSTRGCCGTGKIEVTILCNHLDKTCPDTSKYVFWDSFHPSQRAYEVLTDLILNSIKDQLY